MDEEHSDEKNLVSTPSGASAVDSRRLLGAYYTPHPLPRILTEWALTPEIGNVLDPSFGGCGFLNAATKVLTNEGIPDPGRQVFGVDVDQSCLEYVRANRDLVEKNCIVGDFLTLSPGDLRGAPFQAVVGNPPYVRHHWFKGRTRKAARMIVENAGIGLPARASAWAYFLVHALSFLSPSGRLAMLVPEAILQADYAASIRKALTDRFEQVRLVHIRDRLFEGTDESVVLVAASGFGNPGNLQVVAVERAQDLAEILNDKKVECISSQLITAKGRSVDQAVIQLLGELEQTNFVKRISDVATVRIGLVTGANNHFIRRPADLEELGILHKSSLRVIPRTKYLSGLDFTEADLQELVDANQRVVLVRPKETEEDDSGVRRWIDEGVERGIHQRFKCGIRTPWFRVRVPSVPDAFATCARMGAPLLVLNRADCQCTNALHAVNWRETEFAPENIATGFLTSVVSTWAELHGRRYGGGVLKMEPGAWKHVPVPLVPETEGSFEELNKLIRQGRETQARQLADKIILRDRLSLPTDDIQRLQRATSELMSQRRPVRNGNNCA